MREVALDTNILLRLANPIAPEHPLCRAAVVQLFDNGEKLAVAPQVLVEFWVVATRPTAVNGLGWTPSMARAATDGFVSQFRLLAETRDAFERWRGLVADLAVCGKRAHDVRIAAVLLASGVAELLTLNTQDFSDIPGLVARHPSTVVP